jgi:hypothetical protein
MNHLLETMAAWSPLPTWWQCLLMIIAILLNDISWVFYTRRVGMGRALQAGGWASGIWLTGAIAGVSYIANHWLVVVGTVATFFGTAASVWYDHRRSKK